MNAVDKARITAKLDRIVGELTRLATESQRLQARPTAAAGWAVFDMAEDFRAAFFDEHTFLPEPLAGLETIE